MVEVAGSERRTQRKCEIVTGELFQRLASGQGKERCWPARLIMAD